MTRCRDSWKSTWSALYGPANLPPAITKLLSTEIAAAVKIPEVAERMLKQGLEPIGSNPEELAAFMDRDISRWRKVAADSGVVID